MKKKIRRRPPDEIKIIEEKKFDDMEHENTEKQKAYFKRKPYDLGVKNDMHT